MHRKRHVCVFVLRFPTVIMSIPFHVSPVITMNDIDTWELSESLNYVFVYLGITSASLQNILLAYICPDSKQSYNLEENRGPFQYPIIRLIVRSRKASKPRDFYLELYDHSEILQAPWQQCCRRACQISKRCDNSNYRSRGIDTSRDLTIRRLFGYWNGPWSFANPPNCANHNKTKKGKTVLPFHGNI